LTGPNLNVAARNLESSRQQPDEFFIRRAINWRRCDSHPQGVVMFAKDLAAGSTGNNAHPED
jgi:hypothetical protein